MDSAHPASQAVESQRDPRSLVAVQTTIIAILTDMVQDWDVPKDGEITAATRLVNDLGCCSIDLIALIVSIEEAFSTRNLRFAELLIRDGRYVDDLDVGELSRFVAKALGAGTP
jgi:acyl carrier protein